MTDAIIFVGPTLSEADARAALDATYLPPAAQGDVFRAASRHPRAIGIIDGYFERAPSIWHKEILWAMSEGIHVFGSASMGALRALELRAFGMEGVGEVFEAFQDGELEDDDEVAVAHGLEDTGYRQQSEAMVNIRWTLRAAAESDVISSATAKIIEQTAKQVFYASRTFEAAIARAGLIGAPRGELDEFRRWLPDGRIDIKRADAIAMLERMRQRLDEGLPRKRVQYVLQVTEFWREVVRNVTPDQLADIQGGAALDDVLDELRLEGAFYDLLDRALLRLLAHEEYSARSSTISGDRRQVMLESFRRDRGLLRADELARWRADQELVADTELETLCEQEVALSQLRDNRWGEAARAVRYELIATAAYGALVRRARAKRTALLRGGLDEPSLLDGGLSEQGLLDWYASIGGHQSDNGATWQRLGFENHDLFMRALLREYWFRKSATDGE